MTSTSAPPPNPDAITIRPVRPEDQDALWRILEPIIRAGETNALPRDMTRADALAYWTGADHEVHVAERDGRVVGTAYLRANHLGGGAHIANAGFMTSAESAGQGVGRALCAHSLERARSRGFRGVQFNFVIATNERAVRLWKSFGFVEVGRLPGAFHHPRLGYVDALVLFLTL